MNVKQKYKQLNTWLKMERIIKNIDAVKVEDYFSRNKDIYADFGVQFIDFDTVRIDFYTDDQGNEITEDQADERTSEIEDTIYSAHLIK